MDRCDQQRRATEGRRLQARPDGARASAGSGPFRSQAGEGHEELAGERVKGALALRFAYSVVTILTADF
jgi:hypothetical protein